MGTAPCGRKWASGPGRCIGSRALWLATCLVLSLVGCAAPSSGPSAAEAGKIFVLAAENVWGSIAGQLGGDRVAETSVLVNPAADPHVYEPTPADARSFAMANYVILNGAGYDPWAAKLLAANPVKGRLSLNVGELVGVKEGENPHRWYSPTDVDRVIDQITADYKRLDPRDAGYFDDRRTEFVNQDMKGYRSLIEGIKGDYAGTPVGASESIFVPLADALGLKLMTPPPFMNAITQGVDPTAADKATIDNQIRGKLIRVYVYNRQNATPDVQAQVNAARGQGIPVVAITETLDPPDATFQDWQMKQLLALRSALASSGR